MPEVAREAGVSLMTVSRVLNNPELVSPLTRQAVLDAVARTGYVPNLHAAGLRSRRTRMIACMVPTIASGSAFLLAMQAMNEALVGAGYQVMLHERGYERNRDEAVLEAVLQRRPDGIALIGGVRSAKVRDRLRASRVPAVEIWELSDRVVDMAVGFSHPEVGRAIARHFHALGRRRVASLSSSEGRTMGRYQGFRDEAIKLGIAGKHLLADTSLKMDPPSRFQHGRDGLSVALKGDSRLDGIFAMTDMVALGTLTEARERGLAVPDDLAVVGFGDFDFAEHVAPALTTVRIDHPAMGRQAAGLLMDRIEGRPVAQSRVDLGFEIVTRAST